MHPDELKQLAVRLVAVSELLEQRSERAVLQVEHGAAHLGEAAQSLHSSGQRLSAEVVEALRLQSAAALERGLAEALACCDARLRGAADSAMHASEYCEAARRRLHAEQRRLRWTGWIALLVGSLLATGGSGWLAHEHLRQLEQARFGEDVLAATRRGAITRCGGELCVRLGARPKHFRQNAEYVLLER